MDSFDSLVLWQAVPLLFLTYLAYLAATRLFFHPLSRFPGPRLAALTYYYQGYFEVLRDGGLVEHLETLHAIYGTYWSVLCVGIRVFILRILTGPIVRVNPNEVPAVMTYNSDWSINNFHL